MSNFFTDVANGIKEGWNELKEDFTDHDDPNEIRYEADGVSIDPNSNKNLNPDFIRWDDTTVHADEYVPAGQSVKTPPLPEVEVVHPDLTAAPDETGDSQVKKPDDAAGNYSYSDVIVEAVLPAEADTAETVQMQDTIDLYPQQNAGSAQSTDETVSVQEAADLAGGSAADQSAASNPLSQSNPEPEDILYVNELERVNSIDDAAAAAYVPDLDQSDEIISESQAVCEACSDSAVLNQEQLDQVRNNMNDQKDALHARFMAEGTQTVNDMKQVVDQAHDDIEAIKAQAREKLETLKQNAVDNSENQKILANAMKENAVDGVNDVYAKGTIQQEAAADIVEDQTGQLKQNAKAVELKAKEDAEQIRKEADSIYEGQSSKFTDAKQKGFERANVLEKAAADSADEIRENAYMEEEHKIDSLNNQLQAAKEQTEATLAYADSVESDGKNSADQLRNQMKDDYDQAIEAAGVRKDLAYAGADNREAQGKAAANQILEQIDVVSESLSCPAASADTLEQNRSAILKESAQAAETLTNQADGLASQAEKTFKKAERKL